MCATSVCICICRFITIVMWNVVAVIQIVTFIYLHPNRVLKFVKFAYVLCYRQSQRQGSCFLNNNEFEVICTPLIKKVVSFNVQINLTHVTIFVPERCLQCQLQLENF